MIRPPWRSGGRAWISSTGKRAALGASIDVPLAHKDALYVRSHYDTIFTWNYEKGSRPKLDKLYEKAKKAQWNGQTDLDWSIEVDQEKVVLNNNEANQDMMQWGQVDLTGTVLEKWGDKEWLKFGVENQNWLLSQFMHGEQGALLCTAKIVETVPWIDAKYYAASQVMDEARHVEVFGRYTETTQF